MVQFSKCVIVLIIAFSAMLPLSSQEGIKGIVGLSLPELLHIGARYQFSNIQAGFSVGTFPAANEDIITYSADCLLYLAGEPSSLGNKPWYARVGITSMREESKESVNKYGYSNIRFGREFALSQNIALQLDGGIMVELWHDEIQKIPSSSWFELDFNVHVLPSIGLTAVYSF